MPIPRWFVNGPRVIDATGGQLLVELNPPFIRHETVKVLVHVPVTGIELRHYRAGPEIRQILLCVNNDTIYLTVDPGDRLVAHYWAQVQTAATQCSLYVF